MFKENLRISLKPLDYSLLAYGGDFLAYTLDPFCHMLTSHAQRRDGYYEFWHRGEKWLAHRYMLHAQGHEFLPGQIVMHLCNNAGCINPHHLKIGTLQENLEHLRFSPGHRKPYGTANGAAKLNWTKVREIRSSNKPNRYWAEKCDVHVSTIQKVRKNITWTKKNLAFNPGAD